MRQLITESEEVKPELIQAEDEEILESGQDVSESDDIPEPEFIDSNPEDDPNSFIIEELEQREFDLAIPIYNATGEITELKSNSILIVFSGSLSGDPDAQDFTREILLSEGTSIRQVEMKAKEQYSQELEDYERALKIFEESPDSVKLLTDEHGEPYYVFAKEGPEPPEDVIINELKLSDLRVGNLVEVSTQSDMRSSDTFIADVIELEALE